MTKDEFFDNWMIGGSATREAFRADVDKLLRSERERLADLVKNWHYKKGGYTELAQRLLETPIFQEQD